MDVDYSIPTSSGLPRQKNMPDDEILELIWHNGQVVVQSQNPRLQRKSSPPPTKFPPEDELMSWLQYQLEDSPLFCLPPPHHRLTQASIRSEAPVTEVNFPHLSRTTARFPESGPSTSSRNNEIRESMVDSSDTPAIQQKPNFPAVEIAERENPCMSVSREVNTCDLTLTTSSPGGSGLFGRGGGLSATATTDLMTLPPADDRKRKGREPVDKTNTEYQSEDVEIKSYEPKKQTRGAITRRSRAAEVHNLSERRRRDKINEKMRTLQELIPQSSKTDKVSTLDEAIEYLKSLQMQVQMMSIGCGMVPMMYPGAQQYMSSLGMGMGMGMNPQMMPFPGALSGSAMPTPVGAPSQLNPRFPLPSFQMPSIPGTDPSRIQQAGNQGDFNMAMIPSLPHPYQHSTNIQQASMQMAQNQPSIGKLSAYRGGKYNENPSTG